LFLDKEFEEEPLQPGVGIPVNAANVVARRVGPKVGELDRLAAFGAAPLALQLPGHGPPGEDGQAFEFAEEDLIKKTVIRLLGR